MADKRRWIPSAVPGGDAAAELAGAAGEDLSSAADTAEEMAAKVREDAAARDRDAQLAAVAKVAARMTVKPIHDQILVRLLPEEKMSRGGIVLPDTARNKMLGRGIALDVGPGRRDAAGVLIPMQVKPGDLFLMAVFGNVPEIVVQGEKLALVRELDVLGLLVPAPETAVAPQALAGPTPPTA